MQPAHPEPDHPPGPGAAFFRALLEGHEDVIVVLDDTGTIRYATPSAATVFGPGPVIGARLPDLVGEGARPDVAGAVGEMLGRVAPPPGPEGIWRITGRDGRAVQVQVHSSDLRGTAAVGGLVLTLRDVTGQRQMEAELRRQATYDARTGLPNRKLFEDRAQRAVIAAQHGGTTAVAMLVDLDDFKAVNDTLGHQAGDEVLAAAAARLAGAIRESDTAARYGGDEFAVLQENLPGPAAADAFADRIVRAFRDPVTLTAGQVTITVSVGVATTADSTDLAELLAHADLALYAAKSAGKRQWRAYDPATTAQMPARRATRPSQAAQISDLDFPDPRPDVSGRPAPGQTARPRSSSAERPDRPGPAVTP